MRSSGPLVERFGWLVGVGPGAGTALLFVFSGLLITLVSLISYSLPFIRNVETILPDHDTVQGIQSTKLRG